MDFNKDVISSTNRMTELTIVERIRMNAQAARKSTKRNDLHHQLTRTIIGCAFDVINELGSGFLESVYQKAMLVALADAGIAAQAEKPIKVHFRNNHVGEFFADIVVEKKVILELKTVRTLTHDHEAQIINYLKASNIQVGLLINFGNPKIEYRRYTRTTDPNHPTN